MLIYLLIMIIPGSTSEPGEVVVFAGQLDWAAVVPVGPVEGPPVHRRFVRVAGLHPRQPNESVAGRRPCCGAVGGGWLTANGTGLGQAVGQTFSTNLASRCSSKLRAV